MFHTDSEVNRHENIQYTCKSIAYYPLLADFWRYNPFTKHNISGPL